MKLTLICALFSLNWCIEKPSEVTEAARLPPMTARIWSERCERREKQLFAQSADGGPWKTRCVDAWLRLPSTNASPGVGSREPRRPSRAL